MSLYSMSCQIAKENGLVEKLPTSIGNDVKFVKRCKNCKVPTFQITECTWEPYCIKLGVKKNQLGFVNKEGFCSSKCFAKYFDIPEECSGGHKITNFLKEVPTGDFFKCKYVCKNCR